MEKFIVEGGHKLQGEVNVSAAKNATLPIIAASILCDDICVIENAPMLEDVKVLCEVLRSINAYIDIDEENLKLTIDSRKVINRKPDSSLVRKMRASFLIMGPMLSRFGSLKVALPGGCNIGSRPIDLHLKGFKALGAEVELRGGFVEVKAKKLIGTQIYLDFPSVGATENIMMASVFAKGTTTIENAAEEPEIKDLADYLIKMGAKIEGAGSDTIRIEGVSSLKGTSYRPIFDRIEAGTFMIAGGVTDSNIIIKGAEEECLRPVIAKLSECGINIEIDKGFITINGNSGMNPIDIKTMPYPGFPTDMQAQMMALLCVTPGTSIITETVFENRFMHASELKRMGANIKIDGRTAIIQGVPKLTGCEVKSTDLRAGAALIIGALIAQGSTEISDIYHIDRGYVRIEEKMKALGAHIKRVDL